jgi:hypothetical protein
MKDSSIRFRISEVEKCRIEDCGRRIGSSVSEILRRAAADAVRGEVPGTKLRRACADVRRSANRLLDVMNSTPVDVRRVREEAATLRKAAQELMQCK